MGVLMISSQLGQVHAVTNPAQPAQAFIRLDGQATYSVFKSIVTRVAVSSACNFQVRHTVGSDKFIYTFGDRIGRAFVTGLSFSSYCDEGDSSILGIQRVVAYYNSNRLALRAKPVLMTIGRNLTLRMYLAGIDIDVEDPAQQIWRYQLSFLEVPDSLPSLTSKAGKSGKNGNTTTTKTGDAAVNREMLAANAEAYTSNTVDVGGYDAAKRTVDAELNGFAPLGAGALVPTITPFSINV